MIKNAKENGADAVKFQSYKAETIVSKQAPAYWDLKEESTLSVKTPWGNLVRSSGIQSSLDILKEDNKYEDVRKTAVIALDKLRWKPDKGEAGASY